MKRKTAMCIIVVLLMVSSIFTAANATQLCKGNKNILSECPPDPPGTLDFVKQVWTGEYWDSETTVEENGTIRFKITLTYHKHPENPHSDWTLKDIHITDYLPEDMVFAGNASFSNGAYTNTIVDGNELRWNYPGCCFTLYDNESMSIEFDTILEYEYSEGLYYENIATVNASECTQHEHSAISNVTVYIEDPKQVDFEKLVWDPELKGWVDELPKVRKDENIRFQLTVTYYGSGIIKCMKVEDFLPETCLEYIGNEEFTYPNEEFFEDPEITVSGDKKYVEWNWGNVLFYLNHDESVIIEFDAKVINYCKCNVTNYAYVYLSSCSDCPIIEAEDYVTIGCFPPDSSFEKKVQEGNYWVDETAVCVDDLIKFRFALTYFGNYNLSNIRIVDELPCCLEYKNNAKIGWYVGESIQWTPFDGDISEDGKTIWFNLTGNLGDGTTLYLIFDALVIGATGCGCNGINTATVTAFEYEENNFELTDTAKITSSNNNRPCPPYIYGDETGRVDEVLTFYIKALDYDGDDVSYFIDWGDEYDDEESSYQDWIGPFESGEEIQVTHSWYYEGTYKVKVKAKDTHNAESIWSNILYVEINSQSESNLDISIHRIGFGRICADIINSGDENVSDINWNLSVQGGVLSRINVLSEGYIEMMDSGSTETVCTQSGSIKRGLGRITVTVTVTMDGKEPITETANGFVIGRLVIVRPLIRR